MIGNSAYERSKNETKKTPFQKKWKKAYQGSWEGGKQDDITVLISSFIGEKKA
jgi:hypothetical protein